MRMSHHRFQTATAVIAPRTMFVLVLGALLAACATTPQILPVTPRPVVTATADRGAGRTLSIELLDARGSNVVGLRDANKTDSAITTTPEMLPNIRRALESGYAQQGFTIVQPGSAADVALEVRLTELGYQREASGALPDLKTGATFQVSSTLPEKTVEAVYRDAQTKDTVIKPSLSANAELLNQHIDGALEKLIADPRLTTP